MDYKLGTHTVDLKANPSAATVFIIFWLLCNCISETIVDNKYHKGNRHRGRGGGTLMYMSCTIFTITV